jgi:DNA topoisomerase-6 subunit A
MTFGLLRKHFNGINWALWLVEIVMKRAKSLFDPNVLKKQPILMKYPELYHSWLNQLYEDPSFDDSESNALSDATRSEVMLTETETLICGPMRGKLDGRRINYARPRSAVTIRGWTEYPRLTFDRCSARGVLLLEKGTSFNRLIKAGLWQKSQMLVVCGGGIPRVGTRRILHRLAEQYRLPVYLVADNDTWGYYIFSVLKRGSAAPHVSYPDLAVKDVRYVGLRAGDPPAPADRLRVALKWKAQWDPRLRALAKYSCFRSAAWQRELKAFRRQESKVEIDALSNWLHIVKSGEVVRQIETMPYLIDLIMSRIERREWLS